MLVTNVLHLLVNFLVQTQEVSGEVCPREARMPTRLWETIIVIVIFVIVGLVRVLAPEKSDLRAITDGDLGLVMWVYGLSSANIHV